MIKRTIVTALIAAVFMSSCKKEDALSKIDPNSQDVQMSMNGQVNNQAKVEEAVINQVQTSNPDGKYPIMTFDKKEHDFGTINEGDKVETVFTFTNTGDADLIISNASGSCGCTVPDYPKEPIKPGAIGKMRVSFDSNGKPGMQQKSVTITCNTEKGTDVLMIKANVSAKKASDANITTTPIN